jgi:Protein of unknown function (DUF1761)
MIHFDLNWWAVAAAVVVNMVVGAAWYSKMLFGNMWAKIQNKKMEDMTGSGGMGYGVTTLAAIVQAFVFANVIIFAGANTALGGLKIGLLVWLGFAAATSVSDYVFSQRPMKLWALNQGYYLVVLAINGMILASWR